MLTNVKKDIASKLKLVKSKTSKSKVTNVFLTSTNHDGDN